MTKTIHDFYDAFFKLYTDHSFDRISVRDLARVAGYHRNTFYTNFRSLDDLFDKLKNRVADEIVCRALEVFCSHGVMKADFPQELSEFETWLRLLFERDTETCFSELLCEKCRSIWRKGYRSEAVGVFRDIEIEYKTKGSVAALSWYCRHEQSYSLHELFSFLRDLAK